jgi:capsular exopolysaccharide synthesis family protein
VAAFLQTPQYEATAQVLLQPRASETPFDPNTGTRTVDPARQVQTEIQVLNSEPVRNAVRAKIGSVPKISASSVGQTDVIELTARSTDPARAALVANTYADSYIDFRRSQAVSGLLDAVKGIQSQITELQAQIDDLDKQVGSGPVDKRTPAQQSADQRRTSAVQLQAGFKQKLDQLQVDVSLNSGGAKKLVTATAPTSAASPKPVRNAILALVGGLILGTGLAFLFEYLDDSLRSKEDMEKVVAGVPVVGIIPAVQSWKSRETPEVISLDDPSSVASEAYRALRTAVQVIALDRPLRTLQVTSPSAGEGKTTTLANLAVALARAGQRVVMVCCDLRRPRIHHFFGLENTVGFTSVLRGEVPLAEAVQWVPGEKRLVLLASGPVPANPSELLSGRRTAEVLTALQAQADIVLIDSPPVLPVTDGVVLAGRVDATLLVASAKSTTRKQLQRSAELLGQADAPLVGMVLNGVPTDGAYGYEYHYRYYSSNGSGDAVGADRQSLLAD